MKLKELAKGGRAIKLLELANGFQLFSSVLKTGSGDKRKKMCLYNNTHLVTVSVTLSGKVGEMR